MDSNVIKTCPLHVYRDCSEELNNWQLSVFTLCHDDSLLFLMDKNEVEYYRILHLNVKSGHTHEMKVRKTDLIFTLKEGTYRDGSWTNVDILPDDRYLLVSPRCMRYDDGSTDLNGRIFDKAGNLLAQILLGDGIAQVQTDKNGFIWTSYFDEGVFGNFGWGMNISPIGHSGLIKWDDQGNKVYEYDPIYSGLQPIDDCYSMNVANEKDVWICYYSQFPLVKISNLTITECWMPKNGGIALNLVNGNKVLVRECYTQEVTYYLWELETGKNDVKCICQVQFTFEQDDANTSQDRNWASFRGSRVVFIKNNKLYLFDLKEIE